MVASILITGADGFVGKNAVSAFQQAGFEVHGLTLAEIVPDAPQGLIWHRGNLLAPDSLAALPKKWDAVLHLAGDTVPSLMQSSEAIFRNAQMTLNLLNAVEPTRFLLVSSCHVYAPGAQAKKESDAIIPQGNYGLSKHLAEQVMLARRTQHHVYIARPFNHLGVGMRPELMVPQLMARLQALKLNQEPLVMHGADSIRDFIDVRDIVAAYVAILTSDSPSGSIFNICSGVPTKISEFAGMAMAAFGISRAIQFGQSNSKDDTDILIGDPSFAQTALNWKPRYTIMDSIALQV
jgi:GDP-4-dehydro-6-deoxy-D-mannose reductase